MARHVSACLETCHHADDGRLKQNYSSSVHRPAAADVIPTAHVTLHLHTTLSNIMACMTSTFMGSAVVCKAKVVAAKKNVGVVASMDGLKKVRTRELMLAESSKPIRPGLCTGSRRVEGLAGEAGVVRRGRGGGQRVLFRVEAGGTGVARRDRCAGMGVVIRSRISPALTPLPVNSPGCRGRCHHPAARVPRVRGHHQARRRQRRARLLREHPTSPPPPSRRFRKPFTRVSG